MTRQVFAGGQWHGRWVDLPYDDRDRLCVPVPPKFKVTFTEDPPTTEPNHEIDMYRQQTLVIGPPYGCEGPAYPVRLMLVDPHVRRMVWDPVADVHLAHEALFFNRRHRTELIKRETERRWR